MATAEGVFPKTGNDPLYDSEANLFQPKLLDSLVQWPSIANVSGTTVYTTLGTVNYVPAGSPISSFLWFNGMVVITNQPTFQRLRVSGPGMDFTTPNKDSTNAPLEITFSQTFTSGAITASGGNIGSNYDFSLEGRSSVAGNTHRGSDMTLIGW